MKPPNPVPLFPHQMARVARRLLQIPASTPDQSEARKMALVMELTRLPGWPAHLESGYDSMESYLVCAGIRPDRSASPPRWRWCWGRGRSSRRGDRERGSTRLASASRLRACIAAHAADLTWFVEKPSLPCMKREEFEKLAVALIGHAALQTNPAATLAVGGLSLMRNLGDRRAAARATAAFSTLVDELTVNEELPGDQKQERAEALLREAPDETLDAVLEGFRFMLAAMDPTAQTYVARLTAVYIRSGRQRDWFFRRVGALLAEASAENVRELVALFRAVREFLGPDYPPQKYDHTHTLEVITQNFMPGFFQGETHLAYETPVKRHEFKCPVSVSDSTALLLDQSLLPSYVDRSGAETRILFRLVDTTIVGALLRLFGS